MTTVVMSVTSADGTTRSTFAVCAVGLGLVFNERAEELDERMICVEVVCHDDDS
jgi:hypothetical protein